MLALAFLVMIGLVLIADARAGRAESINDFVRGGFELESPWNMLIAPEEVPRNSLIAGLLIVPEISCGSRGNPISSPHSNTTSAFGSENATGKSASRSMTVNSGSDPENKFVPTTESTMQDMSTSEAPVICDPSNSWKSKVGTQKHQSRLTTSIM